VKNSKFYMGVGVVASMVTLLAIYLFKTERPELGIVALFVGVITIVVNGYFVANVASSGQVAGSTTTVETPGETKIVSTPKDEVK
jgi:hypothetical protein